MTMSNIPLEKEIHSCQVIGTVIHVDLETEIITILEDGTETTFYLKPKDIFNLLDPIQAIQDGQKVVMDFAATGRVTGARFIYPELAHNFVHPPGVLA